MRKRPRPKPSKRYANLGLEIDRARTHLRLQQQELAMHVGVSSRTLLRWENGNAVPTSGQLKTLVAYLAELGDDDAENVAATYGSSLARLGIATTPAPEVAPPLTTAPPRAAAELALYVAAGELGMRPSHLRAPVVAMLRALGALGLTCAQASTMIEPAGVAGVAVGESRQNVATR